MPPYAGIATFLNAPHRHRPEGGRPAAAVLGLPFDLGTTNRPGSRFGPGAIRAASRTLTGDDHPDLALSPEERLDLYDAGDAVPVTADLAGSLEAIRAAAAEQIGPAPGFWGWAATTPSPCRCWRRPRPSTARWR